MLQTKECPKIFICCLVYGIAELVKDNAYTVLAIAYAMPAKVLHCRFIWRIHSHFYSHKHWPCTVSAKKNVITAVTTSCTATSSTQFQPGLLGDVLQSEILLCLFSSDIPTRFFNSRPANHVECQNRHQFNGPIVYFSVPVNSFKR